MATTAPRAFRRAATKTVTRPVTAFTLDWVEDLTEEQEAAGEEAAILRSDVFHATQPTDERLFLIAASLGGEDTDGTAEASAIMELFRDTLPEKEYKVLRQRLLDPADSVDIETLSEVLEWLMEKWTTFPTGPSSGSSTSRASTGTTSTGRVRGQGSIPSRSPSPAS